MQTNKQTKVQPLNVPLKRSINRSIKVNAGVSHHFHVAWLSNRVYSSCPRSTNCCGTSASVLFAHWLLLTQTRALNTQMCVCYCVCAAIWSELIESNDVKAGIRLVYVAPELRICDQHAPNCQTDDYVGWTVFLHPGGYLVPTFCFYGGLYSAWFT